LPRCVFIFIEGINCQDSKNPIHGGSLADIFSGSFDIQPVALKRLGVFRTSSRPTDQIRLKLFQAFCREALVWRGLRHPNILTFFGVDQVTFKPLLCMVAPLMRHGNMMEYVRHLTEKNEDVPLNSWVVDITKGLQYLHNESLVHGDLRGANILIDDNLTANLSDFGLSLFADTSSASVGSLVGGAARWMAPEIMKGSRPTFAGDIYSFGCVCLELHTGKPPFSEVANETQVVVKVLGGYRPQKPLAGFPMRPGLWGIMTYCWMDDPNERPDVDFLTRAIKP